ncbi:RNA-binding, Nab2-type zinc finger [Orobanche gracilis]
MANQLYGYTAGTYGGAGATSIYTPRSVAESYLSGDASLLGTSSRYLSADSISSSALSSSMLYNPDNYSTRISGMSITTPTHLYALPGVDAGSAAADSLYAGLKRTSAESLYHQTLLGAQNKIGQTEAWYSSNFLSKRPRYESTSHLPVYPQRPGEKDCAYYMQTRTCKFGDSCMFDHPIWVPEGGIPDWKELKLVPPLPSETLPERPGQADCPYFLKTQRCKFGIRCKFNHPRDKIIPPGAFEGGDVSFLPERPSEPPCTFYMKTGNCKFGPTCKFHHPKGVQISSGEGNAIDVQNNIFGDAKTVQPIFAPALLHNSKGLPVRPGEDDCPFYLKTAVNMGPLAATITQTDITALGLGPTIYPQRPGELECDSVPPSDLRHWAIIFLACLDVDLFGPLNLAHGPKQARLYYMKTGICKFGFSCKFHHPVDRSKPKAPDAESEENVKLTLAGLPRREGAIHCPYYMKTGMCKYAAACKFDHPPPGEVMITGRGTSSSGVGEGNENGDA